MTKRKPPTTTTPLLEKLLDTAVAIRQAPDAAELSYMARQLVQCTLPHSDPGDVPLWRRKNGALTLTIDPHKDRKTLKAQYPYGSIPRLLLFWLVTEATRTRCRRIALGSSLDGFMRQVGLNPRTGGGKRGDAARLRSQAFRLFRATLSFEDSREGYQAWVDMKVGPVGETWWDPKRPAQSSMFEGWIELGEHFYDAIITAPVPVDTRALRALKRSPLALDLYAWTSYTTFNAQRKRQPRTVPWEALHAQMGGEYADLFVFRFKARAALRKIQLVYPALRIESTTEGLTVFPSTPAIAARAASTRSLR